MVMRRHARFLPVNTMISVCQGRSRCLSIRITNYWRLATGAFASRREITSLLSSPIKLSYPSPSLCIFLCRTHSTFPVVKLDGCPRNVELSPFLISFALRAPSLWWYLDRHEWCAHPLPPCVTRGYLPQDVNLVN